MANGFGANDPSGIWIFLAEKRWENASETIGVLSFASRHLKFEI
jgi:hypothetical protein